MKGDLKNTSDLKPQVKSQLSLRYTHLGDETTKNLRVS